LAKQAMGKPGSANKAGATRKDEVKAADSAAFDQALSSWLQAKKNRDYVVIQAYLNPTAEHKAKLEKISASLRDRLGVAVTFGFGPRFLHSTGQLHKGGPNSVLVMQLIDEPAENVAVPETNYTFDALIKAQAFGDYTALKQRRRRVLRINFENDTEAGLNRLADALRS